MNILALDLGTSCGWALRKDARVTHGSWNLKPKRFEGGGMRYLRFKHALTELKSHGDIDAIYYEEVRSHKGTDAAHIYGGLMATLTAWAEHHIIPYAGIPVGTWKKSLTGNGAAGKPLVLSTINRLGYVVETQDEADALGVLLSVMDAPDPFS